MGDQTIGILPVLVTQVALQVVLALIVAGILGAFHRLYRQAYLRHWSLGWLALAVYVGGLAGGGGLGGRRDAAPGGGRRPRGRLPPGRVAAPRRAGAGDRRGRPALVGRSGPWGRRWRWPSRRWRSPSPARPCPRRSACGASSPGSPTCPWPPPSSPARPPTRVGAAFAGGALLLYGADQLAYFGLGFLPPGSQLRRLPLLMSFDLLATAVIGIALVAWLLEGERERQVRAAELARRRERAQACAYRISEAARTVWDLPGALPLHPREPGRRDPRPELLHRAPRPGLGPPQLPVLRRRAGLDPGAQAARARPHRVRPAQAPAPPRDARGLPGPRGPPRGGAHRERLGGLAGGAAPGAGRGDRGGRRPDLRPGGAARAGGEGPLRLRLRADRRRHRGEASGRRAPRERDAASGGDPAGAGRPLDDRRGAALHLVPRRGPLRPRPRPEPGGGAVGRAVPRGGEHGPRPPPARPAGRVRGLRVRAGRPVVRRRTSSRSATRPAPSAARWGSRWTSPSCGRPTRPCATPRPGSARSSTSCLTSSSPRTRRGASCWSTGRWPTPTARRWKA